VKVPAVPTVNVVVPALVMAGAWLTVRVKFCVAAAPIPLDAVMVRGYTPPLPGLVALGGAGVGLTIAKALVEAMAEVGIAVDGRAPRRLEQDDVEWAELVVTMGCGDACPVLPGKRYLDWDLPDPAGASLADIVRTRYYVPDPADWPQIMPVLGEALRNQAPWRTAIRPQANPTRTNVISRMRLVGIPISREAGSLPPVA